MAILTLCIEPVGALFDDVTHPKQGFDIVHQCRPVKNAFLGHIGGAVSRQAALALNGFDHRRFLATDIGAGTAPQMQLHVIRQTRCLDKGNLAAQQRNDFRIFIAHIDVAGIDTDNMRGNQDALNHPVWIA